MELIPQANVQPPESSETLSRTHLESLTTGDLIRMADKHGIDVPPDLDRIFIIEELLEIESSNAPAEENADTGIDKLPVSAAEEEISDSGLLETVPLPKQYNITFIEVIIRDPLWAFVFWEIKTQDKEQFEKNPDFEGYYLKVSPWANTQAASVDTAALAEGVFTVQVSAFDTAWYLGLTPAVKQLYSAQFQNDQDRNDRSDQSDHNDQKQYKVELCAGTKGEETILAVSSPFCLPLLHNLPSGMEARPFAVENPLVILSGYEDFRVIRNNERSPRTRRSVSAGSL